MAVPAYSPPLASATMTFLPPARPMGPFSVYLKVRPATAMRSIQAFSVDGTPKL